MLYTLLIHYNMTKKFINSVDIKEGMYTIIPSDKNKHLIFNKGCRIILKRYSVSTNVGLSSLDDELQITPWTTEVVSIEDSTATADVRTDEENETPWTRIIPKYASISVQKINTDTYLVTGKTVK